MQRHLCFLFVIHFPHISTEDMFPVVYITIIVHFSLLSSLTKSCYVKLQLWFLLHVKTCYMDYNGLYTGKLPNCRIVFAIYATSFQGLFLLGTRIIRNTGLNSITLRLRRVHTHTLFIKTQNHIILHWHYWYTMGLSDSGKITITVDSCELFVIYDTITINYNI